MTSVLEFNDVTRSYGRNFPVLNGINLSIGKGEVVGLLGRNGAGKTTLIRLAMGMLQPDSGSIRIFGLSPADDPIAVKKRIGYVSEDQLLPAHSTIAELIAFHRYLFKNWDNALEGQLLLRFALSVDSKIRHLSKGQARQVALLCAICHRPDFLILDEPAGGLDAVARREFLEVSVQLLNCEGSTILFSSHQMNDVERIGSRIALLHQGNVLLDRDLDSLRENISIAWIPKSAASDRASILRLPGCLNLRQSDGEWRVLMEGTPEDVRLRLKTLSGADEIRCAHIPLEELFIELVGPGTMGRLP
jgi:ABC-2 type transport system ATP-binding protein